MIRYATVKYTTMEIDVYGKNTAFLLVHEA